MNQAISVSGLSKRMCRDLRRAQWYGVRDIARELLVGAGEPQGLRRGEFWALDDVSFNVAPGESLAVVGRNGAGKSTLLRVLYGLVKPDRGRVALRGRVGALIELGTGFDPVLTGRENVFANAAIHGFGRREAGRLMEEIEEFAGIGDAMDSPLQFYSSGMQARLAYAVAAHLRPNVLLVDEVLAVGDLAYQRKCIQHMQRYLDDGGALIFVSHSTHQIQAICRNGLLLEHGRVTFAGTAVDTLSHYLNAVGTTEQDQTASQDGNRDPVRIEGIEVRADDGGEIRPGAALRLTMRFHAAERVGARCAFTIWTDDLWVCVTGAISPAARTLAPGAGEISCVVPRLPLVGGRYAIRAVLLDASSGASLGVFGWRAAPQPLHVRAETSAHANLSRAIQQLTTLDVHWD